MADDFTLDPLQVQEDILNSRYKAAVAAKLRAASSSPAAWDIQGQGQRAWDTVGADIDMGRDAPARTKLSEQYQQSMTAALQGVPDDIKAQVLNPGTRAEGLKSLSNWNATRADERARDAVRAHRASGSLGGSATMGPNDAAALDYADAYELSNSSNPDTAKRYGERLKLLAPHGTEANFRIGPDGRAVPIAGATDQITAGSAAKAAGNYPYTDKPIQQGFNPDGSPNWTTEHAAVAARGQGPTAVRALPGAVASPVPGPSGPPVSAPISPVSGGNSALPGATGAGRPEASMQPVPGGMQIPPQVQSQRDNQKLQILQQELQAEMPKAQQGDQQAQRNVNALQQEIAATTKRLGPAVASGPQAPQKPGPEAFLDPSQRIMPAGDNPQLQDTYKSQSAQQQQQMTKLAESNQQAPQVMAQLAELRKVISLPTYHSQLQSWMGDAGQAISSVLPHSTGKSTDEYSNTKRMVAQINAVAAPLAKLLGVNPTDRDWLATLEQFPAVGEDANTREQKLNVIEKLAQNRIEQIEFVNRAVQGGYTVTGAQDAFMKWKASQQAPGNPIQAGSGQPAPASTLPSAVSAAQATTGGKPPPPDTGGGFSGYMEDVGRNIVSLPGAIKAQGIPAMRDAFGNVVEGTKELVGMGDREKAMAEIERQDQLRKTNPDYNQARAGADIWGNPASYIPGMTIPKIAGAAAVQGATQPQATAGKQVEEGLKSGIVGAGLGVLSKFVPTSETKPALKAAADEFPSVKLTSSQMTPGSLESKIANGFGLNDAAALGQVKAITKDLMDKSGMKGEGITLKVIDDTKKDLGAQLDKIFAEKQGVLNVKLRVSAQDQAAIKASIDNITRVPGAAQAVTGAKGPQGVQAIMNNAEAPNLGKIYQAFTGTNPVQLSPKVLQEAWGEVGRVAENGQAAAAVRGIIEDVMSRGMKPEAVQAFKDIYKKLANVHDIERIYAAGGGGKGEAAGFLQPSKIEALAKESLQPGSDVQKAMELINGLKLQDPRAGIVVPGTSTAMNIVRAAREPVGWALNKIDQGINFAGRNVPDSMKPMVRALRRPQNLQPGMTEFVGQENQNAP